MNNTRGSALAFVLIIMAILAIMGTALLTVSMAEVKHAKRSEEQMQVQYIARSGVEVGYNKLLALPSAADAAALVANANAMSGLSGQPLGEGSYSISYEAVPAANPQFIKIKSAAVNTADASIKDNVTLLLAVTAASGSDWEMDPQEWKRSMNLWPGVHPSTPSEDFLGKAVKFTSSPTKSPQNGSASVFRASVMMFAGMDNKGITFQQQPQTNDITFDSEVILFYGKSYLRNTSGHVNLNISIDTVSNNSLPPWTSAIAAGFENRDRYIEYVGAGADTYYDANLATVFTAGTRYGLVYFQDDVETGSTLVDAGWYYYPDGTDLLSASDRNQLIEIDPTDPIIEATKNKQGGSVTVSANKVEYGNE